MGRLTKYLGSVRTSLLAAAAVVTVLSPVLLWATGHYERLLIEERRQEVQDQLELRARALSNNFARVVGTLDAMVAVARENADFDSLAQGLRVNLPWVRAFQLVENGVITHVYPLEGNEAALGYNLLDDPRPFIGGDVRRALESGRVTITGPVKLLQGGLGLIVRKPFDRSGTSGGRLAAVVCNTSDFLSESLLDEGAANSDELDLALRVSGGEAFWGEPSVFADDHVMVPIPLADNTWEFAARPTGGWDAANADTTGVFAGAGLVIIALLAALAALLARRHTSLSQTVSLRERELETQHALLQSVVEGTNDAIFLKDADGRYVMANEACARALGKTREEIIGRDDFALFDEEEAREVIARDAMVRAGGRSQTIEETVTLGGERRIFSSVKAPHRDARGAVIGLIGVARDVTEIKLAEQALRESELRSQRTQRLEALGTLAGGIAHDLNNALAPILIAVDALREEYTRENELLDMVGASARRAAEMVKQLVGFARGKEGEHVPLQLRLVLNELRGLITSSFPKNIELEFRLDPNLPLVAGDSTQILQVLTNLCVNARDAMPDGGRLVVQASTCDVTAAVASQHPRARPGPHVVITVTDTGQGIPPEVLEHIYEPFFSTKGSAKGTGLGLSTALGLVRGHDGFMVTESTPGKGTTVKVCLPATMSKLTGATEVDGEHGKDIRGRGETILFVDDEAPIVAAVRTILGRSGYQVLAATSGDEGLGLAATHGPLLRAVITDLHMPRMDGRTFILELKKLLPDVPIGLASGGLSEAEAASLEALGVTRRVDKPFSEEDLARLVRDLTSGDGPSR